MKLNKYEINRRTILKGTGVALALPFLEIMMPSIAKAQSEAKPFIINMIWPSGVPYFDKESEASIHFRDPANFSSVKDYRPYYLMDHYTKGMSAAVKAASYMVGNSRHNWKSGGFGGHYGNSVGVYTGGISTAKYKSFAEFKSSGTNGDDFMMETYDQRIARHFGLNTANATMNPGSGSIERYVNRRTVESISWYKAANGNGHRPVDLKRNTRDFFNEVVGSKVMNDQASIAARKQMLENKDTVLSAILNQINDLKKHLGFEDKARLDDYLTGVRELDAKTAKEIGTIGSVPSNEVCGAGLAQVKEFTERGEHGARYFEKLRVFQDIMTLSMECGKQHVHSLSMGGSGSGYHLHGYGSVKNGMPQSYHSWHAAGHWKFSGGGAESFKNITPGEARRHMNYQREVHAEYARMAVDTFKGWMERLEAKKRPDGTSLFDNTFAAITGYIGDGNTHHPFGIPTFMAGTAGGRIPKHNGHRFDNGQLAGTPKGNIWLSVMQALGIPETQWGGGANTLGGSNGTLKDFNKPHSS